MSVKAVVRGYMPEDVPPFGALLSLAVQQVLTMFPATVLVAILTKMDVGATLFTSGIGTIIALLVSRRRIPMYYGSSFSYIAVIMAAMIQFVPDCFNDVTMTYCPEGVRLVQAGIIGTGILEILLGLLIVRVGKAALDKVLPASITGPVALLIGLSLAGAAINMAAANWAVALVTLAATILASVYLQGKGLLGMLPIVIGAAVGYAFSVLLGIVDFSVVNNAAWISAPNLTLPVFDGSALGTMLGIAVLAIVTAPESTAHLYQMSLYIDALANDIGREPKRIKDLIGVNLIADGAQDIVAGLFGGAAGTNYGENNSLMAITRNYSVAVLMVAGAIALCLAFVGKLAALIATIPVAVTGGLSMYLFPVIGMQGIALMQEEKVDLVKSPASLSVGAVILGIGIGGTAIYSSGVFPLNIPILFPSGVPVIVCAVFAGILLNLVYLKFPPPALRNQ